MPQEGEQEAANTGSKAADAAAPELLAIDGVANVLTWLEKISASNGIPWRAAQYRMIEATSSRPMSLEVRTDLHASYPQFRTFLTEATQAIPGFVLRDLAINRPTTDAQDVDVKLTVGIIMADPGSDQQPKVTAGR